MFIDGSADVGGGDEPWDPRCAALAADVDALAADDASRLGFEGQLERLRAVSRLIDRMEAQRVRLLGVAERSGALTDDGGATATRGCGGTPRWTRPTPHTAPGSPGACLTCP